MNIFGLFDSIIQVERGGAASLVAFAAGDDDNICF